MLLIFKQRESYMMECAYTRAVEEAIKSGL